MSKFNMRLSMFKSFIKLTGGDYLPQLSSLGSNHLFLALCLIFISLGKNERAVAQQLNFGLNQKQPFEEIPHSEYSFQTSSRKTKKPVAGKLVALSNREYQLNEGWELLEGYKVRELQTSVHAPMLNTSDWYGATVPGTVLTTLVEQGGYPDPYWGLNNLLIPDTLCRMDWWYRNVFTIPQNKHGNRPKLIFNGINYRAEVWLNGKLLGNIDGAFCRGIFDISSIAKVGEANVLAVRVIPPSNPGIPHESCRAGIGPNGGVLCLDGPTFISSEGWDWNPATRDRNTGIWQDVRIVYANELELTDSQIITDLPLPDTTKVSFLIHTKVYNASTQLQDAKLHVQIGNVKAVHPFKIGAKEYKEIHLTPKQCKELVMEHPILWWPNGYGNQYLYNATICLTDNNNDTLDIQKMRIGVREMEYELSAHNAKGEIIRINFNPTAASEKKIRLFDNVARIKSKNGVFVPQLLQPLDGEIVREVEDKEMKEHLVVKVNGQRIFCKGGNWGMDDAMKRVSRERLEPYFKLHKNMHYTMIRNWTGESTEEIFYELCDEYGILVFNDFWLSTEGFNLNPLDNTLFMRNVREVVRRYRNHPSIALWCARNEGFAPKELEHSLAETLVEEDGTRHYLGNSRSLNSAGSGPWNYKFDPAWYYKSLAGGFRSEVGTPSLPTAETVREFMAEEDTWPISDVWFYHDWHNRSFGEKTFCELYTEGMDLKLGKSSSLDEFCTKAQLINYESHRAIFEAWNSKMWRDASGILLWMSHPAWPSMVWQNYSSNGETAGAYYGAQKACRPLHIQMSLDKYNVDIINTSLKEYKNVTVNLATYSKEGHKISATTLKVPTIKRNGLTPVITFDELAGVTDFRWIKIVLTDAKGHELDDNVYWFNPNKWDGKLLSNLPESNVSMQIKNVRYDESSYCKGKVVVTNKSKVIASFIDLTLRDSNSGKAIRPAYFNDGYFTLMPNESKEITFEFLIPAQTKHVVIQLNGYNVASNQVTLLQKRQLW